MTELFYARLLPLALAGSAAALLLGAARLVAGLTAHKTPGVWAHTAALALCLLPLPGLAAKAAAPAGLGAAAAAVGGTLPVQGAGTLRLARLPLPAAVWRALPALWLSGALALGALALCRRAVLFLRLRRVRRRDTSPQTAAACRTAGLLGVAVYRLPGQGSPFAAGLLRPAVYLPQTGLCGGELLLALRHEAQHLRRGHLWLRALASLAAVLHWYAPPVWLLRRWLFEACEASCDAAVAAGLSAAGRRAYAALLVRMAASAGPVAGLSRSGRALCRRVAALRRTAPCAAQTWWAAGLAALALALALPAAALGRRAAQNALLLQKALPAAETFLPQNTAAGQTPTALAGTLLWPTPQYRYCARQQPSGLCIVAEPGAPVVAAADGVVLAAGADGAYGGTVVLLHGTAAGRTLSTAYTHCGALCVAPGQSIRAGQKIAEVGQTGEVTGPMLRYQLRVDGLLCDPTPCYPGQPMDGS